MFKRIKVVVFCTLAVSFLIWDFASHSSKTQIRAVVDNVLWPYKTSDTQRATVAIVASDNSSLSSPIAITDTNLTQARIDSMVKLALTLSGFSSVLTSNYTKVVIKPNIVHSYWKYTTYSRQTCPFQSLGNTNPRVVEALVKYLYALDPTREFIIAEGSGEWDSTYNLCYGIAGAGYLGTRKDGKLGIIDSLKILIPGINLRWKDLNYDATVDVTVPSDKQQSWSTDGPTWSKPATMHAANTFIINVPTLKVHETGMTCVFKNYIGTLPQVVYGRSKNIDHAVELMDEQIVDVYQATGSDFVLVDATICKEHGKYPNGWTVDQAGIDLRRNTVIASQDPVAAEVISSRLAYMNPYDVEHIVLAHNVGLGVLNYSNIDVVGTALSHVATPFWKPKTARISQGSEWYYGSSIREWIFSQVFSGTSMSTDQLSGETSAAPEPGQSSWTNGYYFHDNPVDVKEAITSFTSGIVYAHTYFTSASTEAADLWIGSDEQVKIWLNGTLVYTYAGSARTFSLSSAKQRVTINQGVNKLLVKVLNTSGSATFAVNICDTTTDAKYAGGRIMDIMMHLDPNFQIGVKDRASNLIANGVRFIGNFPNPFKEKTDIYFNIPQNLSDKPMVLKIYSREGKLVKSFISSANGNAENTRKVIWDGRNNSGGKVDNGVYFAKITLPEGAITQKIVLSR